MVNHLNLSFLADLILPVVELQRHGTDPWSDPAALEVPSIDILQFVSYISLGAHSLKRIRLTASPQKSYIAHWALLIYRQIPSL